MRDGDGADSLAGADLADDMWLSLEALSPRWAICRRQPLGVGVLAAVVVVLVPRPQPESNRTVAAIEVPLHTPADRADLLATRSTP